MRNALTILKEDPRFASLLPYDKLRELGVEHIASFSGELWTDHNIHDPGITMLEVLCYALTDLGYRTRLDIEELLAPGSKAGAETNFFTPEQILTCNPLTINDYRKMLVDVAGVRNAWLEPAEEQEASLYTGCDVNSLSFSPAPAGAPDCEEPLVAVEEVSREVVLNGLYKVYLDIDPVIAQQNGECDVVDGQVARIVREVKARLQQHRNLCEDFLEVIVLGDEEIGVCSDIELDPNANPGEVLGKVYDAVENFLSPRLEFYSLRQMIEKGKSLEELFEGRPFTPAYETRKPRAGEQKFSHGFVDVKQLERQTLPTTLYASDFYRVIMDVEGVRAIRSLYLSNFLAGNPQTDGEEWILHLTRNHRPVFAPERSAFNFYKGVLRLPVSHKPLVTERFRKRLSDFQKSKYRRSELDLPVPYGTHRSDLPDYHSIQNEFPLVYRIGDKQMPESASVERKVQALQLKGYLAFYDQLLANYLAQMANIRQLFSMQEPAQPPRATYFSQGVDSMPDADAIFRFYQDEQSAPPSNDVLVDATRNYDHPSERDLAIQQLIGLFRNFNSEEETELIGIKEVNGRYSFHIKGKNGHPALQSRQTYPEERQAHRAAQTVLFLGIFEDSYQIVNWPTSTLYSFRIIDNPPRYQEFLTSVGEDELLYQQRRDQFLDHLLARFGEQFTEYVLLMYALNQKEIDQNKILADKARFLTNYPDISRNRGRGFDYTRTDDIWNSRDNVSGTEKRVAGQMGLENWKRRYLNNFEVNLREQECVLYIADHRGAVTLETVDTYSPEEVDNAADTLSNLVTDPAAYQVTDCPADSIYGLQLCRLQGKIWKPFAVFRRTFGTAQARDDYLACMLAYFGEDLGIVVEAVKQGKQFGFLLRGDGGGPMLENETSYPDRQTAQQAGRRLVATARDTEGQLTFFNSPNSDAKGFGIKVSTTNKLNDAEAVTARYPTVFQGKDRRDDRRQYLKNYFDGLLPVSAGVILKIISTEAGFYFLLTADDDETVYFKSSRPYPTEAEACLAWVTFVPFACHPDNYLDLNGNYDGGPHSFGVFNREHREEPELLAFHPRGYTSPDERWLKKKAVSDYVRSKKLSFDIRQTPNLYGWRFSDAEGNVVLESGYHFKTEEQAAASWTAFLPVGVAEGNYRIEPHPGGGFQIQISEEEGLVLARSPVIEEWSDSKAARDDLIALLIAYQENQEDALPSETDIPAGGEHAVVVYEGQYFFEVCNDREEVALRGVQRYPSADEAACAFYHFTVKAADPDYYREVAVEGTCWYSFEVVDQGQVLATHPHRYLREEKEAVQTGLIHYIDKNRLHFSIINLPNSWHYEIWWESCGGDCEPLLVEEGSHETRQAAKDAALLLLTQCDPEILQPRLSEGRFTFVAIVDGIVQATHPNDYTTATERDRVLVDARDYLDHYCQLADTEDPRSLIGLRDKWLICGKSASVCSDESGEKAEIDNCLLSAFRLTKTNQAVAAHPEVFSDPLERDSQKEDLLEKARCGLLCYTELCLQGDRLVTRVDQKYHYELWEVFPSSQLLWRSVKGFETREAALEAFRGQWLRILHLSEKEQNYQSPTSDRPYLSLLDKGEPLVYFPGSLSNAAEVSKAGTKRRCFAQLYPVWATEKGFAFRVRETNETKPLWESSEIYTSVEAAWTDFRNFWELLKHPANYRCLNNPEACLFRIEIREILLEGALTYTDDFVPEVLAKGPGKFDTLEEALAALPATIDKTRQLSYSDFAVKVVETSDETVDGRYQYQLLSRSDPSKVWWQSFGAYANRREAREAASVRFWGLLQLSRNEERYLLESRLDAGPDRIYLTNKNNEKVAFIPSRVPDGQDLDALRQERLDFARRFPFRRLGQRDYRYRLYDPEGGVNYWESRVAYPSFQAVKQGFNKFLRWLDVDATFQVELDEATGQYRHVIKKLWLASDASDSADPDTRYEICPVVEDRMFVEIDGVKIKVSEACDPKKEDSELEYLCPEAWEKGLQNFLVYAVDEELFYPFIDERTCRYSFRVVTDKYRVARNLRESHTPSQREQLRNWLYQYGRCGKRPISQLPGARVMFKNGLYHYYLEGDNPKVTWNGIEPAADKTAAEEAYEADFLHILCYGRFADNYEIVSGEVDGQSVFRIKLGNGQATQWVISDQYFLSEAEALRAINYLVYYSRDWYAFYKTNDPLNALFFESEPGSEEFHYQFSLPNIHWRSYRGYQTREAAEAAFVDQMVALFGYAQELDFYELTRKTTDAGATYQISLFDRNNAVIAVSPEYFTEPEGWNAAILERILHARRFPYYEYEGRYGFQCFSLEDLPDFDPPPTGDCIPKPVLEKPDDCPPIEGQINVSVPGEVIWESIHEYETLEETICVFEVFSDCLLVDLENFQRIRFEDCNLFGIEVTHPEEVLATHPRGYATYEALQAAIERTRGCINTEGFHLVEHILLRPKEGISDEFSLQFHWKVPLLADPAICPGEPLTRKLPYLLSEKKYTDEEKAKEALKKIKEDIKAWLAEATANTAGECLAALRDPLRRSIGIPAGSIDALLYMLFGFSAAPDDAALAEAKPPVSELIARLEEHTYLFNRAEGRSPDYLLPNCPDCCHAEALPPEEASAEACTDPKTLLQAQMKSCRTEEEASAETDAGEVTWYIPGADPYSFWATVVLPYWPERFQNINFRRFFEDTLRREFPAHIAIRICWLDPKQMIEFEQNYRKWLEALSGQENCNLKEAQECLIRVLMDMKTVYPPARLEGGGCASGSGDPNAVLLDYTQLG